MVLDFSYRGLINETYEEIRELSLSLETLFESSYDDVVWFLRLFGGDLIMDHRDAMYVEPIFFFKGKINVYGSDETLDSESSVTTAGRVSSAYNLKYAASIVFVR